MLQHSEPSDFVVATGRAASVEDFCQLAFAHVGLNWYDYVVADAKLQRPAEVDCLRGDPQRARTVLGWQHEVDLEELVAMMVEADLRRVSAERRIAVRV